MLVAGCTETSISWLVLYTTRLFPGLPTDVLGIILLLGVRKKEKA